MRTKRKGMIIIMKKTYTALTAAAITALTLSTCAHAVVISEPYDPSEADTAIEEYVPADEGVTETSVCSLAPTDEAHADTVYCEPVPNETAPRTEDGLMDGYMHGSGDIDIFKYWESYGYPDDVSYAADNSIVSYDVATQTETLYRIIEIGLVNGTEARKKEICGLIAPNVNIYFTDCVYSHADRVRTADEISAEYPEAIVELSPYGQAVLVDLMAYEDAEAEEIEYALNAKYNFIYGDSAGDVILVEIVNLTTTQIGEPEIGIEETAIETAVPAVTAVETAVPMTEPANETIPITKPAGDAAPSDVKPGMGIETGVDAAATEIGAPNVNNAGSDETAVASNEERPEFEIEGREEEQEEKQFESGSGNDAVNGEVAALTMGIENKTDNRLWIWICAVAAAAVVIVAAVFIGRARHRGAVLSAARGGEFVEARKLSRAEVIEAVKESGTEPSDKVFEEIVKKIK